MDMSTLKQMSQIEIDGIDRSKLTDISGIETDESMPVDKRVTAFIEQVKNPYCFLCNGTPVRVRFSDDKQTLDAKLRHYLAMLKQNG